MVQSVSLWRLVRRHLALAHRHGVDGGEELRRVDRAIGTQLYRTILADEHRSKLVIGNAIALTEPGRVIAGTRYAFADDFDDAQLAVAESVAIRTDNLTLFRQRGVAFFWRENQQHAFLPTHCIYRRGSLRCGENQRGGEERSDHAA
ncbi:hypothetical protein SPHINGOAX6_70731 [Sphingomonas sp. AX6]|nr:hypothetical protein SPHINGOAX6_70731 [Sphingomonas sp. AX6]